MSIPPQIRVASFHSEHHPAFDLTVIAFEGKEATNEPFVFSITLRCDTEEDARRAMEETLIGQWAIFTLPAPGTARKIRGHVRKVTFVANHFEDRHALIEVELVSRLWLLTQRTQSRIFQDQTVPEIVDAICSEWELDHVWRLGRRYERCPYVTQYNETDYDFLGRVLAKEGIFFDDGDPADDGAHGDTVVFQDDARLYLVMADEKGRPTKKPPSLPSWNRPIQTGEEIVFGLRARAQVRPTGVRLSDYDFRKPSLAITGKANAEQKNDGATRSDPSRLQTSVFVDTPESDANPTFVEFTDAHAAVVLDQGRRDTSTLAGSTNCPRVRTGHTLAIDARDCPTLSGVYVPIEVHHRGATSAGVDAQHVDYESSFVCIDARRVFRPARPTLAIRAVSETATVIGDGDDIVTDEYGRVKVQFHWSSTTSVWLRVSQPWANAASGAQFIPRVGTEVLVTFLGGDMDRPLVVGSLYNGTHPLPFRTPQDKTRSGFKTKTSGGEGYNELSFEDLAGKEEIRVHAQRNLLETVRNDHRLTVERNESIVVRGEQQTNVGTQKLVVDGPSVHVTNGGHQHTIAGGLTQTVGGNGDLRVAGTFTEHAKRRFEEIEEASTSLVGGDRTVRVEGHSLTIVGEHDRRTSSILHVEGTSASYSVGTTEIVSESAIELRCGQSSIRLTPDSIELYTPNLLLHAEKVEVAADDTMKLLAKNEQTLAAKKILVQAEGASVALSQLVKIDGTLIKLNCAPDPSDEELPKHVPPVPTKFKLVDQDGKPIPHQRFRLVMGDGTERSGFLDQDGAAELPLEASGEIVFPDVDNPRRGG